MDIITLRATNKTTLPYLYSYFGPRRRSIRFYRVIKTKKYVRFASAEIGNPVNTREAGTEHGQGENTIDLIFDS